MLNEQQESHGRKRAAALVIIGCEIELLASAKSRQTCEPQLGNGKGSSRACRGYGDRKLRRVFMADQLGIVPYRVDIDLAQFVLLFVRKKFEWFEV